MRVSGRSGLGSGEGIPEPVDLMHPLMQEGADIAVRQRPPVHEMLLVAKEIALHFKLGRNRFRRYAARFDLLKRGKQAGDIADGLRLAPVITRVAINLVEAVRGCLLDPDSLCSRYSIMKTDQGDLDVN